MRWVLNVNQRAATELGITNGHCALVFSIVAAAASSRWACVEQHEGGYYHWTARQMIASELSPLFAMKPDTVYRHLKALQALGLIDYVKKGKKDLTRLTELGKSYYVARETTSEEDKAGSKTVRCGKGGDNKGCNEDKTMCEAVGSEQVNKQAAAEMGASEAGNASENGAEMDATYPYTIINPSTMIRLGEGQGADLNDDLGDDLEQSSNQNPKQSDGPFAMFAQWRPHLNPQAAAMLKAQGVTEAVLEAQLAQFKLHHSIEQVQRDAHSWNKSFAHYLKNWALNRGPQYGGHDEKHQRIDPAKRAIDHTDTRWADELARDLADGSCV